MSKTYSRHLLWAGDEQSFDLYARASQKFANTTPAQAGIILNGPEAEEVDNSDEPKSRLLQVRDGVGLINIVGVLTDENSWWTRYAGLVAYDEVRQAVHEAAELESITQVLLYVNSPGGSVAGLKDAVDSLRLLSKVKPTTGFTDSQATSAAYWLMAATRKRYASEVAALGSIGVFSQAFEYTEMMKTEGIQPTTFRSGSYKALINPAEKVTDKAKVERQQQVDYLGEIFAGSVAELLGTSRQAILAQEARVYIGQQAVDAGLIDGTSSFDDLYVKLLRKAAKSGTNALGGQDMKKKFTKVAAMALAAGVPPEEASGQEEVVPQASEAVAAESEESTSAAEEATPEIASEEATVPVAEPPAKDDSVVGELLVADPAVVALLKEQLSEAQEKTIAAKATAVELQKGLAALEASVAPLKEIVAQVINNMLVPLNSPTDATLKDAAPAALVEKYGAVVSEFTKWFKAGGVSSVHADTESEGQTEAVVMSPLEAARLKLVKPVQKSRT